MPETYSLGPVAEFDMLARFARHYKVWRKVARLLNKYNRMLSPSSFPAIVHKIHAKEYMGRAIRDSRLPYAVGMELARMYELPDVAKFIKLTHRRLCSRRNAAVRFRDKNHLTTRQSVV